MTNIVTGATYTKESLFQEIAVLREREKKLVETLKKQCGIAFHSANCAFDGANNPCDCGIEQAKAVLREIGEGEKP